MRNLDSVPTAHNNCEFNGYNQRSDFVIYSN